MKCDGKSWILSQKKGGEGRGGWTEPANPYTPNVLGVLPRIILLEPRSGSQPKISIRRKNEFKQREYRGIENPGTVLTDEIF